MSTVEITNQDNKTIITIHNDDRESSPDLEPLWIALKNLEDKITKNSDKIIDPNIHVKTKLKLGALEQKVEYFLRRYYTMICENSQFTVHALQAISNVHPTPTNTQWLKALDTMRHEFAGTGCSNKSDFNSRINWNEKLPEVDEGYALSEDEEDRPPPKRRCAKCGGRRPIQSMYCKKCQM